MVRLMKSLSGLTGMLLCLLGSVMLMWGLSGCSAKTSLQLQIPVPQTLREECPRPELAVETVGDLAAFSVRQEAAISVCNERRRALTEIIDAANERPPKVAWWRRLAPP